MDPVSQSSRHDVVLRILDSWGLDTHQKEQLLATEEAALSVLSIYESLNSIYEGNLDRACQWPCRPNRQFNGRTALEVMLGGDIEGVAKYLRYHVYNA